MTSVVIAIIHPHIKVTDLLLKLAGIQKLERLANAGRLKRIFAGWCDVARDSKRSKEYSKV